MRKAAAFLRLSRIDHGLMVLVATATGAVAAGGLKALLDLSVAIASIAALLIEAGVFAYNDILNIEEDRVNCPERPLVRGDLSLREAAVFGVVMLAAGLCLAYAAGLWVLALASLAVVVGMLYNAWLKRWGPLGNLTVAFSTALPFVYGSVAALGTWEGVPLRTWLFFLVALLATYGREVVKGIKDIEGDRKVGVRTYAIILGPRKAAWVSLLFTSVAIALSVPVAFFVPKPLPYLALVVPVDILLAYSALLVVMDPTRQNAETSRRTSLLGMALGVGAFLLGSA